MEGDLSQEILSLLDGGEGMEWDIFLKEVSRSVE